MAQQSEDRNPQQQINQLFEIVGAIADGLKNSILYILIGGASAALFLAWQWIDWSSEYYWTLLKALPLLIPLALWGFLYSVIAELADLPNLAKTARQDGDTAIQTLKKDPSHPEKTSGFFRKLTSLFYVLRGTGNLATIIDAVKGVVFIANPFFCLLFFIAGLLLLFFILIALCVLIF